MQHCKNWMGRVMAGLALVAMAALPAWAGSVSGDPNGSGISASIPVSATVSDYAEIVFNQCAFSAMSGPGASSTCSDSAQVKSNADVNVTLQPSRLQRTGGSEHLNSSYVFRQGSGAPSTPVSADPGSATTSVTFAQAAAPLDTPTTYSISGSAFTINTETVAGSYSGQIVVTVVKQP